MQPFIQDEFGLSKAQLGGVTSAFSISSGAAQLPAGWLADRIGPTWLITIGVLGVGIGGALVGISNSYTMLLVSRSWFSTSFPTRGKRCRNCGG